MDKMDVGILAAMILAAPHMDASVANITGGIFIVLGMVLSIFFPEGSKNG